MLARLAGENAGPLSEEGLAELFRYVLDLTRRELHGVASRIVCLPGDGIGPEVMAVGASACSTRCRSTSRSRSTRSAAPRSTRSATRCPADDARGVPRGRRGAARRGRRPEVGRRPVRPEAGLIGLRRELDVYANLRPALAEGIDMLIVRELVGGLYYGARGVRDDGTVFDTCEYHPAQIERIARRAFELARARAAAGCSRSTRRTCSTPRGCGAAS